MSRSAAEGLRMMQGGVDRTGFADMAESLGNPGLDLIAARRAEAAQAEAMDEYERRQAESNEEFRNEINRLIEGTQQSGDDPIDVSKLYPGTLNVQKLSKLDAGGRPSTRSPPGRLVES